MKVVWIILGVFFGLFLIVVIAAAIVLPRAFGRLAAESANPSTRAATAAKIARFTLPPGYRLRMATDLFMSRSAVIRSDTGMMIQLNASQLPTDVATARTAAVTSMGFVARTLGCTMQHEPDDVIKVRGKNYAFSVFDCASHGQPVNVEIGFVPGTLPSVQVMGTAVGVPFDRSGFRAFVESMH